MTIQIKKFFSMDLYNLEYLQNTISEELKSYC